MEVLNLLSSYLSPDSMKQNIVLYELVGGERNEKVKTYIASTPKTREVCTMPEIVSPEFEDYIKEGIENIIQHTQIKQNINYTRGCSPDVDYLNILRSGSCFDPTRGLRKLTGTGIRTTKHYVSSQRKNIDGQWVAVQDEYEELFVEEKRKIRTVDLFFGDIVATGTSLKSGFAKTLQAMQRMKYQLRSVYFFTIGSKRAEEVIEEAIKDKKYKDVLKDDFQASVIYLEGRFGLATKDTPIKPKEPDTNLLIFHEGSIIAPEFAASLLKRPKSILEACIIYNGDLRVNTWHTHFQHVMEYWQQLKQRVETEKLTLHQAIEERLPLSKVKSPRDWLEIYPAWADINEKKLNALAKEKEKAFQKNSENKGLIKLCSDRIQHFEEEIKEKTG